MSTSHPISSPGKGASPQKLSALLRKFREEKAGSSIAADAIPRVDRSRPLSASFGQEQLWLLDRLEPGTTVYNMPDATRFRGPLDVSILKQCLVEIIRRHDALRTTFALLDGEVVQQVHPPQEFLLLRDTLEAFPLEERRARLDDMIRQEATTPFDLGQGPLFRMSLFRLAADEHVLLLNFHHVILDGWSLGVFYRELAVLYEGVRAGRGVDEILPPLSLQYADVAAWLRRELSGERLEKEIGYWRDQLSKVPPVLDLPTDWQRLAVQSHHGGEVSGELSTELTGALKTLGQDEGVSLFMILLATFKILLHRLTGEEQIVVGAPSAGRRRPETQDLIGFFLNTLVLRTPVIPRQSFRELLHAVRRMVLDAFVHQDVPFDALVAELKPERHASSTPFFQVMFNMIDIPVRQKVFSDLETERLPLPSVESKFDFTFYVQHRPAPDGQRRIWIDLVFNADLYRRERMAEMLAQYTFLLEQVAARPECRIDELSLLTPGAEKILPNPSEPLDDTWRGAIQEIFSRHAARQPEKIAVADPAFAWSYGELERRSNQLAHHLRRQGLGTGDTVGIYAHRSASLVWAILGTLKAGGAFVMLDPVYPAARLADYARSAGVRAWLEVAGAGAPPAELEPVLDGVACRLRLPTLADANASSFLADESDKDPGVAIGPHDLAYIAFTSGSTGQPKGIRGLHASLTHFLPWLAETFGFSEDDRHALLSALSHDPLQRDVLYPLGYGATLMIPDPEKLLSAGYLARWIDEEKVTVVNLVPAMLHLMTSTSGERPLETLRRAFIVGDVLTHDDVVALYAVAPSAVCVNLYGSTETQRSVSYHVARREEYEKKSAHTRKAVLPLGRGYRGVQLLVLNSGRLAGIGELGEIHFRSCHIAGGYLDADMTRERFLPNHFRDGAGPDRLYRTGDLGRYLPNGGVEIAGRADQQVKLRGFRIELGEIEACMGRHPKIKECAVTIHDDASGAADRRQLVGYFVAKEAVDVQGLRDYLLKTLPNYMVPTAFVELEALPLSYTGKVDRKSLPLPDVSSMDGFVAPQTVEEERAAGIWVKVLGRDQVGRHDNFFELGGHSLLGTQLLAHLGEEFGVDLPLRVLFNNPTLAGLTMEIIRRQTETLDSRTMEGLLTEIQGLSEEEIEKMLADDNV